MNEIINTIIQKKIPCCFISPHLDDAILSCGGLIAYLANKTEVSVLTVFTESDDRLHTLSAKAFLKQCGIPGAKELFSKRREEDQTILSSLGVLFEHLGCTDALWRKKNVNIILRAMGVLIPEFIHVYPTYRFHITSGKISKFDDSLMSMVGKRILSIYSRENQPVLFFPVGLGGHVDHVLVSEVGLQFSGNAIFYSDFPYCLSDRKRESIFHGIGYVKRTFDMYLERKNSLIKMYATQPLFSGEPPIIPETYHIPKELFSKL